MKCDLRSTDLATSSHGRIQRSRWHPPNRNVVGQFENWERVESVTKEDRLTSELDSFRGLWKGGFLAADPLDPSSSLYSIFGFMSTSHATYLRCIKPYVHEESRVLEIGPGRGGWTRTFLHAQEIHCLDALSAEHNCFWEYVGRRQNVHYHHVHGFSCDMLPNDFFTFLFSYDTLCHVSSEGITAYAENLFPKLRRGSHCFWMVADYTKYNAFVDRLEEYSVLKSFSGGLSRRKQRWLKKAAKHVNRFYATKSRLVRLDPNEDDRPRPGRWYHAGVERTCEMLRQTGYSIVHEDVGTDFRSPIIEFSK